MTYCVGLLLNEGLVLASDTRTNAGVDQIGTFRKMSVFENPGDRMMVLMSAGNLSISQSVRPDGRRISVTRWHQHLDGLVDGRGCANRRRMYTQRTQTRCGVSGQIRLS